MPGTQAGDGDGTCERDTDCERDIVGCRDLLVDADGERDARKLLADAERERERERERDADGLTETEFDTEGVALREGTVRVTVALRDGVGVGVTAGVADCAQPLSALTPPDVALHVSGSPAGEPA